MNYSKKIAFISFFLYNINCNTYCQNDTTNVTITNYRQEHSTFQDSIRSNLVDSLLNYATKYLGKKYKSGAKGPQNFDCSGFTSYIFSKYGYNLNRSSYSQYTQGTKVEYDKIKKGDLVFFLGRNLNSKNVGHVGIVYDIDTINKSIYFIHASVNGGVKIDIYPDKYYYYNRYIGAKRIIQDDLVTENIDSIKIEPKEKIDTIKTINAEEKIYKVTKGDNLYRIAKKYNCKINDIKGWNNLKKDNLSIGQEIIIK